MRSQYEEPEKMQIEEIRIEESAEVIRDIKTGTAGGEDGIETELTKFIGVEGIT